MPAGSSGMTIAEKILEVGLICLLCKGSVTVYKSIDYGYHISCTSCGANPSRDAYTSKKNALAAWIVLTGGPIPGVISPPKGINRYPITEYKGCFGTSEACLPDEKYWLWPDQRTVLTVTEWLQREQSE